MSTDPKPPKPMPSAAEINAYVELSAARTRLRLPLAKGNALSSAPTSTEPSRVETVLPRPLPLSGVKVLPTRRSEPAPARGASSGDQSHAEPSAGEVWRPFTSDDEH